MILAIGWLAVIAMLLTLALPAQPALWVAWGLFALIALLLFGHWFYLRRQHETHAPRSR